MGFKAAQLTIFSELTSNSLPLQSMRSAIPLNLLASKVYKVELATQL